MLLVKAVSLPVVSCPSSPLPSLTLSWLGNQVLTQEIKEENCDFSVDSYQMLL